MVARIFRGEGGKSRDGVVGVKVKEGQTRLGRVVQQRPRPVDGITPPPT